jgi:Ca2+-binding EF-hand superfamily protein
MENLEHSNENNEAFIDFKLIRDSIKFSDGILFQLYLKDVYEDLSKRDEGKGISKLAFDDYFKIPVFIAEKLFLSMDKDNDGFLSEKEFLSGMQRLFLGDFKDTVLAIFDVLDFDKDGCITRADVRVLCSYLPVKAANSEEMQIQYKHQMRSLEELEEIVTYTFRDNPTKKNSDVSKSSSLIKSPTKISEKDSKISPLTFENFLHVIQNRISDIYLNLLCFLYQNKPFSIEKVNGYMNHKSNKNSQVIKKSLSINVKQRKESNDNSNLMPSPKKTSVFHSTHTYMETINMQKSIREKEAKRSSLSPHKNHSKSPQKNSSDSQSPKSAHLRRESKPTNGSISSVIRMTNSKIKTSTENLPLDGLLETSKNIYNSPTNYLKHNNNESISDFNLEDNLKTMDDQDPSQLKDVNYENFIFVMEKDKVFKKYYMVLIGKEITLYVDEKKDDKVIFHNLSGCFLNDSEEFLMKDKTKYFQFSIVFSKYLTKYFYTIKPEEKSLWVDNLKFAIGYFNFLDYYEVQNDIDEGRFGKVKLGVHKSTGEKVAIKIIKKDCLNEVESQLIRTEIDLMKLFRHINIVRLLDHFENETYIYIVMEYLSGGNISRYLESVNYNMNEKQAARIIYSVAQGIKYMNSFGIIHRDIKPENIMLTNSEENAGIKIIDFGLTKTLSPSETLNEGMGTISYVAPEVVLRKPYNKEIDVWSLGVLLYLLLSGCLPFDDPSSDEEIIAKKVVYLDHSYPDQFFSKRSKESLKLIDACLVKEPEKRISIEYFLKNEWLKSNIK